MTKTKSFQSPFVISRPCWLPALAWACVFFQFSVFAIAQGTGEWDGVMSPEAEEHHRLGVGAMSRGEWKEALRELRKALKYTPKAVPVYNSLGEVNLATGEIDRAVVNFRIAIALGPLFAPAYANMGRALESRKDLVGAREFYEGALRLKPAWVRDDEAWPSLFDGIIYIEESTPSRVLLSYAMLLRTLGAFLRGVRAAGARSAH